MLALADCAGRREAGRKAERLGRALRRGLPVPGGVVLLPGEPIDGAALRGALVELGAGPFVVRSSAAAEDQRGQSAAGLFLSLRDVGAEDVAAAAAQVRASGASPLVRACLGGAAEVAVLIQPQLAAERLGVLQLPARGPALAEERVPEEPEWGESAPRRLDDEAGQGLLAAARDLAALLREEGEGGDGGGSGDGGDGDELIDAQIEYAWLPGGALRLLQVRPAAPARAAAEPWEAPDAALRYDLDREHNPEPLSPAQASLVALVEPISAALGLAQRVVRGYLYVARSGPRPPGLAPAEFWRLRGEVLPACDALLSPLEERAAPELGAAVGAYQEIYRRYVGEIGPTLRRVRGALDALLGDALGAGLASPEGAVLLGGVESATSRRLQALWRLGGAAEAEAEALLSAYLRDHGAAAPAWDVAAPCDDEAPARVRAQAAALARGPEPEALRRAVEARGREAASALRRRLPAEARGAFDELLPLGREALALGEDDDVLFFRAQRLVRRAILGRGAALVAAGRLDAAADALLLPIAALLPEAPGDRSAEAGPSPPQALCEEAPGDRGAEARRSPPQALREEAPEDLRVAVAAAAAALAAQRRLAPPDRFEGGRPLWSLAAGSGDSGVLRGRGVAGPGAAPVRGPARVITALDAPPPVEEVAGAVLVLPALLPSWAPQLLRAAALVTDSGGALSHGATLAREAGVPAVVGARGATAALRDGDEVLVDAARGLVLRLRPGA